MPPSPDDSFVQIPRRLIPYIIGVALGGGGTFSVNAIAGESALSDTDLAKIEVIVNKAVSQSENTLRLETKIDIKAAIEEHVREQKAEMEHSVEAHVRQYHK